MAITKKDIEKSLIQLRRISAHREIGAEKEIRRLHKALLKDLKQFVAVEYAELAKDGKLTYEILQQKGEYARFLEEVENRMNNISPKLSKEIKGLIENTYEATYKGMQEAVAKSATTEELKNAFVGLHSATPETIKSVVEKGLVDDVLKKNWQDSIYQIKREIAVGLANGDRIETMAKRISKSVDTDYQKAIRIARTENHRAREAGFHDSATDINETLKQGTTESRMVKTWRTMKDERVRPNVRRKTKSGWKTSKGGGANHQIMEGVTIPVDEKFELSSGDLTDAPSQSGNPNEDINCRCYLSYSLMTDSEYYAKTGKHFKA